MNAGGRGDSTQGPSANSLRRIENDQAISAASLLTRLGSISEPRMRSAVLGEQLCRMSPDHAADFLRDIHDRTIRHSPAKDLWAAFACLVETGGLDYEVTMEIYRCLVERGRRDVAMTLIRPAENASEPERSLEPGERRLTLGERKSLARKSNRVLLERLAKDPDPSVIRIWLENPRLVENDVVRLAAARQANPVVLRQVAAHTRWNRVLLVVRALVFNPATPLDTKLRLLPTLRRQDIEEVRAHASAPDLAQAAAHLLERA